MTPSRVINTQEKSLKNIFSIFNHEVDLLFMPYGSRTRHSRSLTHPFVHVTGLIVTGLLQVTALVVSTVDLFYGQTHIKDDLYLVGINLVIALLDVVNCLTSTLSFLTRSLATMQKGYTEQPNDMALKQEDELHERTMIVPMLS